MHRLLLLSLVVVSTGCYTLAPVGTAVREGSRVAFDLNDAGRVAMAERVGPEILQMEGRLISAENGDYTLSVRTVRFLRGGEQVWAGERVNLTRDHVSTAYERRFSAGRTAMAAAITVGAVAAVIIGRELIAGGDDPNGKPPEPQPELTWPPVRVKP